MSDPYDRIIWSADVNDVATLVNWLDQMPKLRRIKIDRTFVDGNDWDVFEILRERAIEVFDDAKISEIPSKLEAIAKIHARRAQPWMLNCMASGGLSNLDYDISSEEKDGLKRFADACHCAFVQPCAVSVLTSKSPAAIELEYGNRTSTEQVLVYATELVKAGFTHLVCSPLEVSAIRDEPFLDVLALVTPGVRPAGSDTGDQQRVDTPANTIMNGSNYLVIGRPITQGAGTPAENLDAIAAEIEPLV